MNNEKYKSLVSAVQAAAAYCTTWNFMGSSELYEKDELLAMAQLSDEENPTDEDSFYVIYKDGSIGFLEDEQDEIDWILIPMQQTEELPENYTGQSFKFCSNCGTKVKADAAFCFNCGQKL